MAQAATNPKIEELRFRLKADSRSRLFYPLAEELRKISQYDEAESVLRTGLSSHPTYLSAWVSLGRVLRDQKKNDQAVEALNRALQLDPGNVVAARILADAYLALGEKVEAIKKYKLVYALLPADEQLEATIAALDAEINAPAVIPEPAAEVPVAPQEDEVGESTAMRIERQFVPPSFEEPPPPPPPPAPAPEPPAAPAPAMNVFDDTAAALKRQTQLEFETGDSVPMSATHEESPFEEPGIVEGYGGDAFSIEQPDGMHLMSAPMTAEIPSPVAPPPADEADVFEPASSGIAPGFVTDDYSVTSSMPPIDEEDFARTIRMADLFAAEGSINEARDIYEDLLARDPDNRSIRSKLESLIAAPAEEPPAAPPVPDAPFAAADSHAPASKTRSPKIEKLENWLARVKRV